MTHAWYGPPPPQWSPYWPPPGHDPRPPLDATAARLATENPAPWGWSPVVLPCAALVGLVVAGTTATHLIRPHSADGVLAFAIIADVLVEGLLALSIWLAGRDVAARHGGWGRTFGWRRPVAADFGHAGAGICIAFAARVTIVTVADGLTHGAAGQQSENLSVHSITAALAILLVVLTVVCAPLTEEVMFRGLLLRTFMRRVGFWPAALASTLIFGLFHTYEVATFAGAVTLALAVGVMGLVNCVLVRLTDRLTPGILVHATLNGLATLVIIVRASNGG